MPGEPLLIFDGDCGFCTTSAQWIERRLPSEVAVVPWQALDFVALGLSEADVQRSAWFVDHDGVHGAHRAVARSLRAAGGMWAPVGWLLEHRPISWLAALIYPVVARYRYRLPGATDACRLPQADGAADS